MMDLWIMKMELLHQLPKWPMTLQTLLIICKEDMVSVDQIKKLENIWFLLVLLWFSHSNIWELKLIGEIYYLWDGKCMQSEMVLTIIILEQMPRAQKLKIIETPTLCERKCLNHKIFYNYLDNYIQKKKFFSCLKFKIFTRYRWYGRV